MFINAAEKYKQYVQSFDGMLRLVLYKGEVFRLPQRFKEIQILSGRAWLTMNGKDILVEAGQKVSLATGKDIALISTVRDVPVVLEARRCGSLNAEFSTVPS
jgi:hypothetical protein